MQKNENLLPVVRIVHSRCPILSSLLARENAEALNVLLTRDMPVLSRAIQQTIERLDVIYQTRATVFHRDIQTPRRELKMRRAAEYF